MKNWMVIDNEARINCDYISSMHIMKLDDELSVIITMTNGDEFSDGEFNNEYDAKGHIKYLSLLIK